MAVGALEQKFWALCCQTLGRPDLAGQHIISGARAAAIRAEVAALFKSQPQAHWVGIFDRVDCCVTPVLTMAEAMENEQLRARGMFVTSHHPIDGPVTQYAFPVKFSEFEFAIEREAPLAGEHSEEILAEAGFSAAQIAQLRAAGVI
jgi:crotonobetainyl-CoA:carnitine CoA-transferase CaiB-like acyl-CoA transferase